MNVVFNCPHCQVEMTVDESGVGESVGCPTCSQEFVIPQGRPEAEVKAEKAAAAPAPAAAPVAPAQKPKEEKPSKVPSGTDLAALLPNQKKKSVGGDGDSSPGIKVKCFQHHLCIDMGKDLFAGMVSKFLAGVDKEDIISATPLSYSYKDSGGDIITDYGVMIIYTQK
jgi:hypothetical protein